MTYGITFLENAQYIQSGIERDRKEETRSLLNGIINVANNDQIREVHKWIFENQKLQHRSTTSTASAETQTINEVFDYDEVVKEIRAQQMVENLTSEADMKSEDEIDPKITKMLKETGYIKNPETQTQRVDKTDDKKTDLQKDKTNIDKSNQRPRSTTNWSDEMEDEDGRAETQLRKAQQDSEWREITRRRLESKTRGQAIISRRVLQEEARRRALTSSHTDSTDDSYVEKAKLSNEATENLKTHKTIDITDEKKTRLTPAKTPGGDYPIKRFIKQAIETGRAGTKLRAFIPFMQTEKNNEETYGPLYSPFLTKEPTDFSQLAKTLFSLKIRSEQNQESIRPLNPDKLARFIQLISQDVVPGRLGDQRLIPALEELIR